MKQPVDHILRPRLPWRDEVAITECGYDASKMKALTRDEAVARFKEFGRQRFAMFTCMTCMDTAERHGTWDKDPRKALEREIAWECQWRRTDHGQRLRDELLAIADLIGAHKDEFVSKVAEIQQRREWNEKKAAMAERPKPTKPTTIIHGL